MVTLKPLPLQLATLEQEGLLQVAEKLLAVLHQDEAKCPVSQLLPYFLLLLLAEQVAATVLLVATVRVLEKLVRRVIALAAELLEGRPHRLLDFLVGLLLWVSLLRASPQVGS